MSTLKRIALLLVIIGGINWGLIGLFQFDLVATIFGGQDAALSRIIYSLVGIGALFSLTLLFSPMGETDTKLNNSRSTPPNRVNYGMEAGEDYDYKPSNRDTDPYK